jgi:hypothetical protein
MLSSTEPRAFALLQNSKAPRKLFVAEHESGDTHDAGGLAIHLTTQTLGRAVRGLLPFYGVNCPIAIYDDGEEESLVARGTLGAIEGWTSPHPSLLLVIG